MLSVTLKGIKKRSNPSNKRKADPSKRPTGADSSECTLHLQRNKSEAWDSRAPSLLEALEADSQSISPAILLTAAAQPRIFCCIHSINITQKTAANSQKAIPLLKFCSLSETIPTFFHLPFCLHVPTFFLHSVWMLTRFFQLPRCGRCRRAGVLHYSSATKHSPSLFCTDQSSSPMKLFLGLTD